MDQHTAEEEAAAEGDDCVTEFALKSLGTQMLYGGDECPTGMASQAIVVKMMGVRTGDMAKEWFARHGPH